MPMCIEGYEKNNRYKLNSYQKETKKIIDEYGNTNSEIKLEDYLRNCANTFKKVNLIIARTQIESIRYTHTEYPANLENNAIKQKLQFFSSIIGFIDGLIDNYNHDIDFFQKFENEKERVQNDKDKQKNLSPIRSKILKNFSDIKTCQIPQILEQTLEMTPSYENFSKLYQHIAKDYISGDFQVALTTAYGVGYKYAYYTSQTDKMLSVYSQLFEEMKQYQISMKEEIEIEKEKSLRKSINQ